MKPTKKPQINPAIINAAIPDNIDKFISFLHKRQIKYNEFLNSNENFKQKKIREFIILHPEVLQMKLF